MKSIFKCKECLSYSDLDISFKSNVDRTLTMKSIRKILTLNSDDKTKESEN